MKYDDMDDGQNFIYWATGIPPQEHLNDIGYKKYTAQELYRRFIKEVKSKTWWSKVTRFFLRRK